MDGELESVCRCGGKSYAKAGAIIDMLFKDADRIVGGVGNAAPRILADQIGRENERLRRVIAEAQGRRQKRAWLKPCGSKRETEPEARTSKQI